MSEETMMQFPAFRIRYLRVRLGLEVTELAARTGIAYPTLAEVEGNESTRLLRDEQLRRLAYELGWTGAPGELDRFVFADGSTYSPDRPAPPPQGPPNFVELLDVRRIMQDLLAAERDRRQARVEAVAGLITEIDQVKDELLVAIAELQRSGEGRSGEGLRPIMGALVDEFDPDSAPSLVELLDAVRAGMEPPADDAPAPPAAAGRAKRGRHLLTR